MARRHTPYYHKFTALGAEIVDRIGFDAAYKFTSVEEEHLATRRSAGLYDVYYQVIVDIKGRDAEKLLQKTLVNDAARLASGQALYSFGLQRGWRDNRRPHLLSPVAHPLLAVPDALPR